MHPSTRPKNWLEHPAPVFDWVRWIQENGGLDVVMQTVAEVREYRKVISNSRLIVRWLENDFGHSPLFPELYDDHPVVYRLVEMAISHYRTWTGREIDTTPEMVIKTNGTRGNPDTATIRSMVAVALYVIWGMSTSKVGAVMHVNHTSVIHMLDSGLDHAETEHDLASALVTFMNEIADRCIREASWLPIDLVTNLEIVRQGVAEYALTRNSKPSILSTLTSSWRQERSSSSFVRSRSTLMAALAS